jgi:hypothetical protein
VNYFERLVRRATLRPAERAGAGVVDPFERTEDWPLDAPRRDAPRLPSKKEPSPMLQVKPAACEPATQDDRGSVRADITPAAPAAAGETRFMTAITNVVEQTTTLQGPNVHPERVSIQPPTPEAAALAHADAFLRGLGVPVPDGSSEVHAAVVPPAPVTAPADRNRQAPVIDRPHVINAPVPPREAPVAAERERPSAMESPQRASAREERASEPAPRARPPAVTREIVVIERGGALRDDGAKATPGVGSPHIGLGQL